MDNSVSYAVTHALKSYLSISVESLLAVYEEWPNPSQPLKMPCASILTQEPRLENAMPYCIGKTLDEESGKHIVRQVIGIYEFRIQLDLWATNKQQRQFNATSVL